MPDGEAEPIHDSRREATSASDTAMRLPQDSAHGAVDGGQNHKRIDTTRIRAESSAGARLDRLELMAMRSDARLPSPAKRINPASTTANE